MNISAHSSLLTGIINELNEFLEIVKICGCKCTNIIEFGQKPKIALEYSPSKECGDENMKSTFTAFQRLVEKFVLMEENIKNSMKKYALLDLSALSKCSPKFADLESESPISAEKNVIASKYTTLGRSNKSCKYCRKRFSTKELFQYHMLQLHEKMIPG